jgi:L-fucose mutarotase
MLDLPLTHPGILEALAGAGHGSMILIADGHYPVSTASNPAAARIYLNLRAGLVDANSVLECVAAVTPIEAAIVMTPAGLSTEPPVWSRYRNTLASTSTALALREVARHDFYELARTNDLAVVIATGETEIYANLLLTIGVNAELDTRAGRL